MGTRHLTAVMYNGEYKVAQYGQWDGYPEGQGINILKFLTNEFNRDKFIQQLSSVDWVTDKMLNTRWLEFGHDREHGDGFVSCEISDKFDKKYPELSRNTGSNILPMIQNHNGILYLQNSIDFASDSLYCEWAYVVDLDNNLFEVYEGFNEEPLPEGQRFSNFPLKTYCIKDKYYPVKHRVTYNFDSLPSEEDFLKFFNVKENEDEE